MPIEINKFNYYTSFVPSFNFRTVYVEVVANSRWYLCACTNIIVSIWQCLGHCFLDFFLSGNQRLNKSQFLTLKWSTVTKLLISVSNYKHQGRCTHVTFRSQDDSFGYSFQEKVLSFVFFSGSFHISINNLFASY